ncbi:unnamed protein product [Caenorhabditis angaria]|uniref:Band 7 domain-containing protein n=1 Tax=Caenorhabditis angaria TaxID=860376 RepID=A0A9P1J2Z9_9PELO|nr:unnamed protein product [Caenorhabditis angaria]
MLNPVEKSNDIEMQDYSGQASSSPPRPLPQLESQSETIPVKPPTYQAEYTSSGFAETILKLVTGLVIFLTFPISVFFCVKVVQEYQRAVIFRLGRLVPQVKGPGIFFINPCIDKFLNIDLRVVSYNVPSQEILSRDSVTVSVDAVVYYKVFDPITSVVGVEDASNSTRLLAQTTLRTCLGAHTLTEMLSEREKISADMKLALDEATVPWGIKVERVELRDVRLPAQMQRAMAAEAEAQRDAGAKIIAANGELKASAALAEAAEVISKSEGAMQLRYLHTLNAISCEKTSTIIFPFPIEILGGIQNNITKVHPAQSSKF